MFTKIEIDEKNKVIYWGSLYTQEYFVKGLNWVYVSKALGYTIGFHYKNRVKSGKRVYCAGSGTKENNQKLTEQLGISPKKFAHMLRGAQYRLWIKGKEDLISKLCVVNGHWNVDKIRILNKNWGVIKQYQDDGLDNLIPVAMYIGKSTKELKEEFGKSLWKSICNNSFYRNKFIFNEYYKLFTSIPFKEGIKALNKIPTSIYRYSREIRVDTSFIWGCKVLKEKRLLTKCEKYLYDYSHLCYDTIRMSERLSSPFNPDWSYRRMKEAHDEYTIRIQTEDYPDEFISCLKDIPVKEMHRYQLSAKLIDTPLKIALQGKDQHHCVGSYINQVKNGSYLVYDIWDDKVKERVSTLGVSVRKLDDRCYKAEPDMLKPSFDLTKLPEVTIFNKRSFTFSQHYKKFNASVRDENDNYFFKAEDRKKNRLEFIAEDIIEELNKRQYEI